MKTFWSNKYSCQVSSELLSLKVKKNSLEFSVLTDLFLYMRYLFNFALLELGEKYKQKNFDPFAFSYSLITKVQNKSTIYKNYNKDILLPVLLRVCTTFSENRNKPVKELIETDKTFNHISILLKKNSSFILHEDSFEIQNIGSFKLKQKFNNYLIAKQLRVTLIRKENNFFVSVQYIKQDTIQPFLFEFQNKKTIQTPMIK